MLVNRHQNKKSTEVLFLFIDTDLITRLPLSSDDAASNHHYDKG